jgi:hypothetical protein
MALSNIAYDSHEELNGLIFNRQIVIGFCYQPTFINKGFTLIFPSLRAK